MQKLKTLRLILGDQLNSSHSWYTQPPQSATYLMMEIRQETDYVTHHIQKIVGFFAAMRAFAAWLRKKRCNVIYLHLDDPENSQDIEGNLQRIAKQDNFQQFEYQAPDEHRLDLQLADIAKRLPLKSKMVDTEHFLTKRDDLNAFFKGRKRMVMETFYRHMRKKHAILIEDGKPLGGKWNFDLSNRKRYDGAVPIPSPYALSHDVKALTSMLKKMKVKTIGRIDPTRFIWPINRQEALKQLNDFVDTRLAHFGKYQDAMTSTSWSLFHSRLSFALNTKMLSPIEVIQSAVDKSMLSDGPAIDIAALEGFVRQILGWREYVRGIYWAHMPQYAQMNYFEHKAPLPDFYWSGETDMACMQAAINHSLDHAYAHHIHRLMITGNFALVAQVAPDAVDEWYLGIYIDALQWVEIVNTRGMSQYADGGIVATKPYAASANYIKKMSDYCTQCAYRAPKKTGEGACPFNSLYWHFIERNRKRMEANGRMKLVYRVWDRFAKKEQKAILAQADDYLSRIDQL